MTQEILDVLNKYGLPGWALILIGGGTIVAAVISAFNAIVVAAINAWATKRVAIYTAHREDRATMSAPLLQSARPIATFALEVRRTRIRSHAELVTHTARWLDRAREFKPISSEFFPDTTVYRAWSFMRRIPTGIRCFVAGTPGGQDCALPGGDMTQALGRFVSQKPHVSVSGAFW